MKYFVFGLVAMLGLLSAPAIAQNLIVNGGFENEPNYSGSIGYSVFTGSQIPGWTVEPGTAVTMHNNTIYPFISGTYSVNTDGEGSFGNNANFYQDFASVNGQQYQLDYDWQLWTANAVPHLDVSVTDTVTSVVLYSGNFAAAAGTHHVTALFAGSGNPLRLRVRENPQSGINDNTFIVDNFAVTLASSTQLGGANSAPTLSQWAVTLLVCALAWMGVTRVRRARGSK
ncbi:MAG: IPTL-CTERM sorting domain-containing protein [Proteobacteria bacterium]|uniref:IPTL-CTERM sorting domain-containing protein n=1 Tax=Rudaea sp. TaxID=2136325 RepID=UPI0032209FDA|nr:IPTL-CTERM sorting domain-containing protein [Pseudomonadota bacterium]